MPNARSQTTISQSTPHIKGIGDEIEFWIPDQVGNGVSGQSPQGGKD
jgi:hypothetical protein